LEGPVSKTSTPKFCVYVSGVDESLFRFTFSIVHHDFSGYLVILVKDEGNKQSKCILPYGRKSQKELFVSSFYKEHHPAKGFVLRASKTTTSTTTTSPSSLSINHQFQSSDGSAMYLYRWPSTTRSQHCVTDGLGWLQFVSQLSQSSS